MSKSNPHFGEVFEYRSDFETARIMYIAPVWEYPEEEIWHGQTITNSRFDGDGEVYHRLSLTMEGGNRWFEVEE